MIRRDGGLNERFLDIIGRGILGQRGTNGPRAAGPTGPVSLKQSINDLATERASFAPNRMRSLAALDNAGDRGTAAARRSAAMVAAQNDKAIPTSFASSMNAAERRAKVRQGVANRGEAAVRNQQLKDRLKIAQGQASRRGALINTLQTAAGIKEGVNVGVSDANNRVRESQAAMWGSIAGAAGRVGKNMWDNRASQQPLTEIDTSGFPSYRGTPTYDPATGTPIYPGTGGGGW